MSVRQWWWKALECGKRKLDNEIIGNQHTDCLIHTPRLSANVIRLKDIIRFPFVKSLLDILAV